TSGNCRCNNGSEEFLSEIETGAYTLPFFNSGTGYLWFETSSDLICGEKSALALDFEVAQGGNELLFNCDAGAYILNNTSLSNAGHDLYCAGEAFRGSAAGC